MLFYHQSLINVKMYKIVYFREVRTKKTDKVFRMENAKIVLVQQYKYLVLLLNEHLICAICDNVIAKSGSRALAYLINKYNVFLPTYLILEFLRTIDLVYMLGFEICSSEV